MELLDKELALVKECLEIGYNARSQSALRDRIKEHRFRRSQREVLLPIDNLKFEQRELSMDNEISRLMFEEGGRGR